MSKHSRREHQENPTHEMPPARVYPADGIPIPGRPGLFRMRSGSGVYAVNRNGAVIRVGELERARPAA